MPQNFVIDILCIPSDAWEIDFQLAPGIVFLVTAVMVI